MRISLFAATGLAALGTAVVLSGQNPASAPAFEVASVKPWDPPGGRGEINGFYTYPGGRIVCNGCTLQYLIMEAFDVQTFQIAGGPGWMTIDRFAIEARPPASSKSSKSNPALAKLPPNEEQRQMVQTLLADRFRLKFHRETKEGSVYALAKGGKATKLQEPKDPNGYPWAGGLGGGLPSGDGLAGTNISMPQLVKRMSDWLGRPVLDETGLAGSFDFRFEYHSDEPNPDVVSSIITSFQGLGLKLESTKGPVETIVIDRAEKPSEN
jgi:uncharacterized protein (TIGR03435 family)